MKNKLHLREGESLNDGEHSERLVCHRTKVNALRRLRAAKAKLGKEAGRNFDRAIKIVEACGESNSFDITIDDCIHATEISILISTAE